MCESIHYGRGIEEPNRQNDWTIDFNYCLSMALSLHSSKEGRIFLIGEFGRKISQPKENVCNSAQDQEVSFAGSKILWDECKKGWCSKLPVTVTENESNLGVNS